VNFEYVNLLLFNSGVALAELYETVEDVNYELERSQQTVSVLFFHAIKSVCYFFICHEGSLLLIILWGVYNLFLLAPWSCPDFCWMIRMIRT
jgi:hypothetical protein